MWKFYFFLLLNYKANIHVNKDNIHSYLVEILLILILKRTDNMNIVNTT